MKQGNPTRRFGLVALIGAMLSGIASKPEGIKDHDLQQRRTMLLTNGGNAPIPNKLPNQRQRRKLNRQMNRFA